VTQRRNTASAQVLDLTGRRFGRLLVLGALPSTGNGRKWRCQCDCGNETEIRAYRLNKGYVHSCGCLTREVTAERNRTHGMSHTPTHRIWCGMNTRCYNESSKDYRHYGGRGITVCDRWRNSFEAFLSDMGERPPGMSIERVDNSKGYEPGNCRWASQKEQTRNRRGLRYLEMSGETKCLAAWATERGMKPTTLLTRLHLGWSVEEAITTPVGAKR
jgi:hypothetical protein